MDGDHIAKTVRIYGDFEEGEFSKILPNMAFGYNTIVVERPLRLNFQVSADRIARLDHEKSLSKSDLDLEKLKATLVASTNVQRLSLGTGPTSINLTPLGQGRWQGSIPANLLGLAGNAGPSQLLLTAARADGRTASLAIPVTLVR